MPALLVTALVAVGVTGAARPVAVPAPAPSPLGALRPATVERLTVRYATTRADIGAAERTAREHGDVRRAASLHAMAVPGRRFLSFDGRDGGRSAEVFGDLPGAERIAVLVPGSDTGLDRYGRLLSGARALSRELGPRSAVVAWLGYATPSTIGPSVLTPGRADEGAPALRDFVGALRGARPGARLSLVCHSYGSVVCGRAAHGLPVNGLVLYGSPGTGHSTAAELGLRAGAQVWVARGARDWIASVPHTALHLPFSGTTLGLGADPLSPAFGARVFDAGRAAHSDYLRPGTASLRNIARLVAGREPVTTPGRAAQAHETRPEPRPTRPDQPRPPLQLTVARATPYPRSAQPARTSQPAQCREVARRA